MAKKSDGWKVMQFTYLHRASLHFVRCRPGPHQDRFNALVAVHCSSITRQVLVFDRFCCDMVSVLFHVADLRKHSITLMLMIEADRQAVPDAPAIYFVQVPPRVCRMCAGCIFSAAWSCEAA